MTKIFSLKNFCLLFTLTLCLLQEKLGSDWFKECLENRTGIDRCIEYDFIASMTFLSKKYDNAAFSPLYSDYIIHLKYSKINFDSDEDEKMKNNIKYLKNQLNNIVSDKCNFFSLFFIKNESLKNCHAKYSHICDVFTESDPSNIFKKTRYYISNQSDVRQIYQKHVIWVKNMSHELISSSLRIRYPRKSESIHDSFAFFDEIWARKFDNASYYKTFQLFNGLKTLIKFIHKKDYFKYAEVTTEDLQYQIVAIPYQEKKQRYFSRYMVYVISSQHNTDLSKLWDSFYTFSNGKIQNLIIKMNMKEIDIYIPIVNKLQSSFDLKDLFFDALKYDTDSNDTNRMMTYFNVDENGAEEFDIFSDDFGDNCDEVPLVMADRPYISFVFDIQFERIIFFIKDTGMITIDNFY